MKDRFPGKPAYDVGTHFFKLLRDLEIVRTQRFSVTGVAKIARYETGDFRCRYIARHCNVSAQDVTDKMVGTWKIRTDKFMPPDDTIAAGTNVVTKTAPHTIRTVSKQVLKNGEKRHSENVQVGDGRSMQTERTCWNYIRLRSRNW